jgi:hypothetical protein
MPVDSFYPAIGSISKRERPFRAHHEAVTA